MGRHQRASRRSRRRRLDHRRRGANNCAAVDLALHMGMLRPLGRREFVHAPFNTCFPSQHFFIFRQMHFSHHPGVRTDEPETACAARTFLFWLLPCGSGVRGAKSHNVHSGTPGSALHAWWARCVHLRLHHGIVPLRTNFIEVRRAASSTPRRSHRKQAAPESLRISSNCSSVLNLRKKGERRKKGNGKKYV